MVEILENISWYILGKYQNSNAISNKALTPLCEATRTELAKEIYICAYQESCFGTAIAMLQPTQALKLFTRQKSY